MDTVAFANVYLALMAVVAIFLCWFVISTKRVVHDLWCALDPQPEPDDQLWWRIRTSVSE